jgi:hypothetical protein
MRIHRTDGYPTAYEKDKSRPDVFDPALKHRQRAFVKGPPPAKDAASALERERSRLLHLCLEGLAGSRVRDELVVRGSVTLERWFPGRARPAHDLDLVVRNPGTGPHSTHAPILLGEIEEAICKALAWGEADFVEEEIALEDIWTYERAEGRRLSVPWFSGKVRDVIQVDVVFREPLQDVPTLEVLGDDPAVYPSLWFASRAESLAWKLLWLETDSYPQGKDLYDALLLAEHVALPVELVSAVYAGKGETWQHGNTTEFVRALRVDWTGFTALYPALPVEGLLERFATTLVLG